MLARSGNLFPDPYSPLGCIKSRSAGIIYLTKLKYSIHFSTDDGPYYFIDKDCAENHCQCSLRYNMDLTPSTPAPNLFSLSGQNILITGATRGNRLISSICVNHLSNKRNRGSMRSRTGSSRCSFHWSCPKTLCTQFTFKHLHFRNHPCKMPLCPR